MGSIVLTHILNKQYDFFKKSFNLQCFRNGLSFDEDIYQDTVSNCYEKYSGKSGITLSLFANYLWKSFKQNTLRDLKYQRNLIEKEEIDERTEIIEDEYNEEIDEFYKKIIEEISSVFGKEYCEMFRMHHENGKTYIEICDIYDGHTSNELHEKFREIRKYIKNKYKKAPWQQ